MPNAIECLQLTKAYGPLVAVSALDLRVPEGTIFGFLGPNGAGKSTTIRVLMGFLRPTAGKALVMGLDSWRERVRIKAGIGFLSDTPALYNGLTGREFLDYMERLQHKPATRRKRLLQRLEVSESVLARPLKGYSRGMRQKIAITQSLQHEPRLVVMDEPSEGLDPLMQQALYEIIQDLQREGCTVFFSSHVLTEVERLCQHVAILRGGRLVAVEEVAALRLKKVREMQVLFRSAEAAVDLQLPCIVSAQRDGRSLRLRIQGDINPLLAQLAAVGVDDLVFEPARLEDVFMAYYSTAQDPAEKRPKV